ncbi:MAG TPA: DUF4157 domain-containing protein [Bacteroidia bacterium]|nr:DUF4157 domain-containing protein [Bacteroidia bacterium]
MAAKISSPTTTQTIGSGGNFFAPVFIQPKLTVNSPGDIYEQEADAMADKVMRMNIPDTGTSFFKSSTSFLQRKHHGTDELEDYNLHRKEIASVQRKCAACEEEGKHVHRKENSNSEPQGSNELDSYVSTLSSSGQSLPESSRQFFEPRFGQDFSNVKIHTDSVAAKSAQSINALAYTTGNNIVFNQGQYSPNTESGQKLMAHELTHVVQQQQSYVQKKDDPTSGEKVDAKSNDYESTIESMTENMLHPEIAVAKWGFHFIEGIGESGLLGTMHQSVGAFKANLNSAGNIASFYFGINAGVPKGVAEDLYANIKGIIMLAAKIIESEFSFYTDPMGFFDSVKNDLLSLWEVIRTDPKILGKLAGDALAGKVNDGFVKKGPYDQGLALGEILGEIVTEIALLFIGVEEVSAVAKLAEGTEIGAKLINALNKSETLGKVAQILGTGKREAGIVNDANKAVKLEEAAKAAGEMEKLENSVGKVTMETEEMLKGNKALRKALLENEEAAKLLKLCNSPCYPGFATTEQIEHLSTIIKRADIHGINMQQKAVKEFLHNSPDAAALGERIEQLDEKLSNHILNKHRGEPTFDLEELTKTEKLRNTPGTVAGGNHLPAIGERNVGKWFKNLEKNGITTIPKQVAEKLKAKGNFKTFREFRETLWKFMAEDPVIRGEYERVAAEHGVVSDSVKEMEKGFAPFAEKAQTLRGPDGKVLGGTKSIKVQLNHQHALELMGNDAREVYDLDNLEIVSPLTHVKMTNP